LGRTGSACELRAIGGVLAALLRITRHDIRPLYRRAQMLEDAL
jgi:hypothetical protein